MCSPCIANCPGIHCSSHGSVVLQCLDGLFYRFPIDQRVMFKLVMTICMSLNRLAPGYLADNCVLVASVASRWQLRSADTWEACHLANTDVSTYMRP